MSTALYRRYRPETFAEVIGQEHVTGPLITALQNNRVNHAYLFSGPRGCGKTTSARILARCLNCAEGPTPTPCGVCDSCVELARDGSGSLDVIEMDAASHGGVDHARDLRERATFAPVRDRYKIFIIDEAHMVTREGFNALLKIVEEPPEHIKFIFATTEPNKVLGTIRSRTHHYPFRLVPPETLQDYLAQLCEEENVQVAEGVLPLVVRAGGGSVRDSLSILDQLMAGSNEDGITYDLAVSLLGFTHGELLDEVVLAFATGNAADVFRAVDRVIQTGQDPHRFVEDLLERFRDLIIVQAVPDAADAILHGMNADQIARLRSQASAFGQAELSRSADVTNSALNEMSGSTSPQLHLELMCARILLPSSDKTVGGVGARLDRLERRVATGDIPVPQQDTRNNTPAVGGMAGEQSGSSEQAGQSSPPNAAPPLAQAPLANLRQQKTTAPQSPQNSQPDSAPSQDSAWQPAPSHGAPSAQPVASSPTAPPAQKVLPAATESWNAILDHVQSPNARSGFAQCTPSKFERGALYIKADIATLRRVKDFIPELKVALREVLQLNVDVHAEVAKGGAPSALGNQMPRNQTQGNRAQNPESQQNSAPQNSSTQQVPPIAEGPRGGEEAWRAHGQPRTNQAPQWSTEDWNNPVTSWDVAPIPSENSDSSDSSDSLDSLEQSNSEQTNTNQSEPAQSPQEQPARRDDPAPETAPQLRLIDGELDENSDHSRQNHPSSGRWKRPDIAPAPSPKDEDENETGGESASPETEAAANSAEHIASTENEQEPTESDQIAQGLVDAEKSAESSPAAASPADAQGEDHARYENGEQEQPSNTGIADGSAESAPAEESRIPDPDPSKEPPHNTPVPDPKPTTSADPKVSSATAPARPIASEYGDYEGGHFDDAPEEEPEYVAGVGYVNATPPVGAIPPLAQRENEGSQPAPRPVQPQSAHPQQAPAQNARTQNTPVKKGPTPNQQEQSKPGGFRERFAAQLEAGHRASEQSGAPTRATAPTEPEDFAISEEDEALETSVLIGQRAVEKILGGVVIDEKMHGQ